jgi:N-acetylmuramoyl-L-alanine amidase
MRKITTVIVHHTASPSNTTIEDIKAWHTKRGFYGIGYHYVIDPNGKIHSTRPVARTGAHARGHNADSIGVALIGNFEKTYPTGAQLDALDGLILILKEEFHVKRLIGHKDAGKTACPGKYLYPHLDRLAEKHGLTRR